MTPNAAGAGVIAPLWFKSSYSSGPETDSCVEVAAGPSAIHVRDSKDVGGPRLALTVGAWAHFVRYASEG
ncbi:DUF397 domain-containing protein [Streptomyces sp. NBC_01497]|uniref:DUF397 domain-containing protein n=1 Tax=Streptomyces sp. NBC_01497 TaxID=2903885 RepID=UPI002E3382BC|nr:DUF397 domain-containing protein [Streptomyces sp. NBC_01497]